MSLNDDGGDGRNQQNVSSEVLWNDNFMIPRRDPLYIVVPVTIMYSIIFITGVIGNIITCLVIAKHKYMHTATNYYLFSLAVSDLILLVSGLPQEMWSIWSKYPYIFGEIFCQLRGLFAEMSANATVLTITAFTAERYVAICHPFMAQSMSKLSRAVKLIIIIWLVAILFAIPQALQFTVSPLSNSPETDQCNIRFISLMDTDIQLSTVSFTMSTLLFFVLPMIVITVLYALIGLRLRRTDKLKRTVTVRLSNGEKKISSPEYRANSSSKVLKMLVAVVVAFFICWAPFHAQRLIAIFGTYSGDLTQENLPFLHQLYGISTYISGVLYYMSTTINPILYHIMSLKFRTAFKETVLRRRGNGRCGCGGRGFDASASDERHDQRPGRRRQRRWRRRDDPATAAPRDGQQWRDRAAGQTGPPSVGLAGDDDVRRRQRSGCCCRALRRGPTATDDRATVGCFGCGCYGGGGDRCDDGGSTTPPEAAAAAWRATLTNWTMISNSSLEDVDGDGLRDELIGYYAAATATDRDTTIAVTNECY